MKANRREDSLVVELGSEAETEVLGRALAVALPSGSVVGLNGPLGAGKTRLVRAIAEALDVPPGTVTSPTFMLIQEYEGRIPIYHFDTYRLKGAEEFAALDSAAHFGQPGVCLVEWADRVAGELPRDAWSIAIEATGERSRRVVIRGPSLERLDDLARLIAFDEGPSGS